MRQSAAFWVITAALLAVQADTCSGSVLPSSTPTPAARTATPPPPERIHVSAVTTLPTDPRFFQALVPEQNTPRILLFDSSATRPPVEVVRTDPPAVPVPLGERAFAFGASADGRVLVVARRLSKQETLHYRIRPESGEVVTLRTEIEPAFTVPLVSPDGARYAYLRSGDADTVGIWIADTQAGATPKRIVAWDPLIGLTPVPVAWSPDGAWLAVSWGTPDQMGLVNVQGGEAMLDMNKREFSGGVARVVGPGHLIDWGHDRGEPLLITSAVAGTNARSVVYSTSVAGGPSRDLYVATGVVRVNAARWHPAGDQFYVHEVANTTPPRVSVWIRRLDGSGTKLFEAASVTAPWWSKDGTRLWSVTGGDNTTGMIRDLLSTTVVTFCLRSAGPSCT